MEAALPTALTLDHHSNAHNNKRTHDQMATGSVESHLTSMSNASGDHRDNSVPSTSATPVHLPIVLPPFINRPRSSFLASSMSQARETEPVFVVDDRPQMVIDLTIDEPDTPQRTTNNDRSSTRATRPPNFDRDIIDVDALPDRPPSPEVQFTFARPAPPRVSPARPVEPVPNRPDGLSFIFGGGLRDGQGPSSGGDQGDGGVPGSLGAFTGYRPRWHDLIGPGPPRRVLVGHRPHRMSFNPSRTTQSMAGFIPMANNFTTPHLSYEEVGLRDPPPSFDPPEPAREGFTRSPKEGDTIVCPNCDDELGSGDTDEKRSVWFVKGCGHVYCGECTKHRSIQASKKGEPRSWKGPPFKTCKVCNKSVSSPRAMRQIFL